MFGGYTFGDLSKSVYKKATSALPARTHVNDKQEEKDGYRFGDLTKSTLSKVSSAATSYKTGDMTKSTYYSLTGFFQAFTVDIKNPIKQGYLKKCSARLRTRRELWTVLEGAHLYLFTKKQRHDTCIESIDLAKYHRVVRIVNGPDNTFELKSRLQSVRFIAPSAADQNGWSNELLRAMNATRQETLDDLKQQATNEEDATALDLQCVSLYIVNPSIYDLEFVVHTTDSD